MTSDAEFLGPGPAPTSHGRRAQPVAWILALLLSLVAPLTAGAPAALADGDPGSDVLVYQPLFLASDAGISLPQQARLGGLLTSAAQRGVPIRVAIISSRADLGAVTALWQNPRGYARFLGLELSLAYTGRLLVVMPDGYGFAWPGHSTATAYRALGRIAIGPGGSGLAAAAQAAVLALAAQSGVRLTPGSPTTAPPAPAAQASSSRATQVPSSPATQQSPAPAARAPSGSSADEIVAAVAAALALAAGLALLTRRLLPRLSAHRRTPWRLRRPRPALALAGTAVFAAGAVVVVLAAVGSPGTAQSEALGTNPNLDPGTSLRGQAPDFTLTDQFGQTESLSSFRGKVVLLAFNDSECTTICPMTTTAMLDAKAMLGAAGAQVQLLGVDANPKSTSLEDVQSYSQLHGMLHAWYFLTGSLPQLERVWSAYHVEAAIQGGQIAHTPALFIIDPRGRLAKLYITQQSYAAVGQLGQLLAQEASSLLPRRPAVHSHLDYTQINGISPANSATLPRAGGGSERLGPGRPHLYLFFATWDQEITSLAGQLDGLDDYAAVARSAGLPALTAVDEGSVEPSPAALGRFLTALPRPLAYPVAIDSSGRIADGYEVQGQPWFVLTSPTGQILWYWQVSTSGWLGRAGLVSHVRAALAKTSTLPAGATAAERDLRGSPAPLAALHEQADRLLGSAPALLARIRALRGYPVVINAWASWCGPCRSEFGLFATASALYGRQVAFLGADTEDSAGDAQAFLAQHPVSYPSYEIDLSGLDPVVPQGLADLPTTVFLNRAGKLVYVHIGQYDAEGTLDADIQSYALGR
jgi:cytochrome oxidase Cu insertion factor (SCO1/SenC/PrrC family)/thiol-disulfide isomerase/thioredoxin